ncbi:MAG: VOC family protein [Acidobacteriota bacterium]
MRGALLFLLSIGLLMPGRAVFADELKDPLAPKTSHDEALTYQLHTATLIAHGLDEVKRFYADGLGLELEGPIDVPKAVRKTQRKLWGIPKGITWQLYRLHRPKVAQTVQVRLLVLDQETPRIHTTWDAREPGPFSLGFPTAELEPWDSALREMGFESMNPMSRYEVPRPDGSRYGMHETIWKAPDFMHTVTLSRRNGMPQLGPIDAETGRGGPVYSAQSIEQSDDVLAFYTDVLGMELRSDREWKSHGSKGALAVPDGTVFRFSIVYAPGASHGHLLFIDFRDGALPSSGVAPRPPNRGLTAWTFPVRDLAEIERRIAKAGVEVVGGPVDYDSPLLGAHRALTVLAPNGFLVELIELPKEIVEPQR